MFSTVRMERVEAALLKRDSRAALRRLGDAGDLELIPAQAGAGAVAEAKERRLTGRTPAARLADLRCALGAVAAQGTGGVEMDFAAAVAELDALEAAAESVLKPVRELSAEYSSLSEEAEKLGPYRALPLPAGGLDKFLYIYCAAGALPAQNLAALRAKAPPRAVLLPLEEKDGLKHLVGMSGRSDGPALASALKLCGFQPADLPVEPGSTLASLAERNSSRLEAAGAELALARRALGSFAGEAAGRLAAIEGAVTLENKLNEAESGLGRTETSVLLTGWIPAEQALEFKQGLAEVSGGRCAARTLPPDGEVPVLLRPPRLLRPFAALVGLYGLPRYGEVEPTVFAAVSYLFMFGMMFGDTGQGAVLCLAGLWLWRYRAGKLRDAGKIIFYCGLSGAAFGLVYGSFFGLPSFRKYALWRDPLEGDPLALLKAAVITGIVVISAGVLLNIVNKLRAGDRLGAALDRFGGAGLVFYWCALLWAAGAAGPRFLLPPAALALACWVLKEPLLRLLGRAPAQGGAAEAAAEALVGAFEGVLLYLANTVSFVRLAAYAMSHAALLTAAWALAGAADKTWGAGSLAGIFALVAGNAAAIGLEGLVAGVQALRLEYYEFFGKFLEGNGRPFKPFTLKVTGGME